MPETLAHDPNYKPKPGYKWAPDYRIGGKLFSIKGVTSDVCPVAYITQRSLDMLEQFSTSRHAHEASGASLFGPRLVDWPEWAVDAMTTIEIERVQYENARAAKLAER